jgi:hypothetical protein
VSGLLAYLAPNLFTAPFSICATIIGFLLGSQDVRTSFSPVPLLRNFLRKESSLCCINTEVIRFSAFLSGVLVKFCLRVVFAQGTNCRKKHCWVGITAA